MARERSMEGPRRRTTTIKKTKGGPISLNLWERRRDRDDYQDQEIFSGRVRKYVGDIDGGDDDMTPGMIITRINKNKKFITNKSI